MPRNITRDELKKISAQSTRSQPMFKANASVQNMTFLSHSSKDKDLVMGAMEIIANHGGLPYIDEVDPEMPRHTSEETADLLKQRINQCNRFILLTSENSKESRWVPWELGVADGSKGPAKIAVFAASTIRDVDSWSSWEYMGLYPRITWGQLQGYPNEMWMVYWPKANNAVPLEKWLRGY
ncbi:TIR domain-containing protein [Pseudomonas frederiksbergensis]|uniref:TIR domain-containing protein n=1 Tax=Pseudomonas frederiksbergensis TaxID=104087 RepID=UPI003D1DCBA0